LLESKSSIEFTVLDWLGCILLVVLAMPLFGLPIVFLWILEDFYTPPTMASIILNQLFSPLGVFTIMYFILQLH
jgi:hypothetical protein